MSRQRWVASYAIAALIAAAVFGAGSALAVEPLRSIPDPALRRAAAGRDVADQLARSFSCPEPPPPVVALSIESAYRPDDPTQSQVDRTRSEAYTRQIGDLRVFTQGILAMSDRYVGTRPRDGRVALCVVEWLGLWARNGAMLPASITAQGNAERKWNLVSLSLSYAMTRDAPEIEESQRKAVEDWLRRLGRAWADAPDFGRSRPNNHLNWGGLALMASGSAVQDRALFDQGLDLVRQGLKQVQPDGSLPLEMERGPRSVSYHIFALQPLAVAAELAWFNGIDLYAENDGALDRLAVFVRDIMMDPDRVSRRVGVRQDWPTSVTAIGAGSWGWAIPYTAVRRDERLEAVLRRFPPEAYADEWIGNMALQFGRFAETWRSQQR